MALPIKYSTSQPTRSGLRKDDLVVGTGDEDYGTTATTTYWNNINIPTDGYIVTTLGLSNSPISFAAATSAELILIDNYLGGTATTLAEAKEYLCTRASTWLLENSPNNMVTDDLVFDLNAGSLSSYPGSGTSAMDLSGLGRDGSLDNGVGFNSNGYFAFDGVDDKIVLNNTLDTPFTTQNWTVDIWFNIDSTYVSYDAMLGNGYPFQLYVAGGKVITYLSSAAGSGNYFLSGMTSTQTISTETWYHLSFVRDGTNYYYYINGVLDKSATSSTSVCAAANGNAQIGNLWNVNDAYAWDGDISNVKIYKKSLTQAEINQNYYQGPIVTDGLEFAVDAGNLVSYAGGDTTTTSLIGSNTGTLTNGVGFDSNYGGSFDFDGVDDYMQFPSEITISGDFTFEIWINPSQITSPFSGIIGNSIVGSYYIIMYTDGRLRVRIGANSPTPFFAGAVLPGEWTLLTIRRTGSTVNVYSNTVDNAMGGVTMNSSDFKFNRIGSYSSVTTNYLLNGKLASVSIYNKALTQAEINQNYNAVKERFVRDTFTVASGGTITTDGDYKIHTFTSSGTFTVTEVGENPGGFEYLIVAGGGGGGTLLGSGGGAGGFLNNVSVSVSATAHTVTVGAGGAGATVTRKRGASGNNSVFSGITATGGGGGGANSAGERDGGAGGSGGGASYNGTAGAGTAGQGNNGGVGRTSSNFNQAGGGGAGAVGGNGTSSPNVAGDGGIGLQSDISGTNTYYAGGGGGSAYVTDNGTPGDGGLGGGGDGGVVAGSNADANTGGGGGGADRTLGSTPAGGNGGSGIVIIRYKFQ